MYRRILLLTLLAVSVVPVVAQRQAARITTSAIDGSIPGGGMVYHANRNEPPRAITFKDNTVTTAQFVANINQYLQIPSAFTFIETESNTDQLGMKHYRMQQFYQGFPIENMAFRVHEKNGFVRSANGKAVREIHLDTRTTIREEQAFRIALRHLNSKDSVFRPARKLIVSKGFTYTPESFVVAYQFEIDVNIIERWKISIDMRNGNVVNKISLIQSCFHENDPPPAFGTGTGTASYYGTRDVQVELQNDGSSRLYGKTPSGGTIHTYDLHQTIVRAWQFGFFNAYEFWSSNNTFDRENDKAAIAAHWSGEHAYEFYYKKLNRRSFDNNNSEIKMYVHLDVNLDNAFWGRNTLVFGDGSNNNPLVELDVVGHELTHGVTQYEANLSYYYEPGALNESFSDIFGKAIEFCAFGDTATWQLARRHSPGGMRDMSNPNRRDQPDTYQGDFWYTGDGDYGGVHYNSGVQNFWFYLLCEGGEGTNDHGFDYSVQRIGMDAAVNIVYRNLTEYLDYDSDYLDSRIGSLLATADLYGADSDVYKQVDHAWDAVGVIDEPIITSVVPYDITATTVKFRGTLIPRGETVTYYYEYGTTPAFGSSTPAYAYTGTVSGHITGLQSQTKYYVRLVATNEKGTSYSLPVQFTTLSLKPLVKIKQASDITETSAVVAGELNANSLFTSFHFEYGTSSSLGLSTPVYQAGDATEFVGVTASISDLEPRKKYYYRLVATNGFASATSELSTFFSATKPIIESFTPRTATVGSEVIISGKNFNTTPSLNAVTFGATRATVLSSSATQMTVTVPKGASHGVVALTDLESGLAAESIQEFVPTFTTAFRKGDLQLRAGINDFNFSQMFIDDMDRDGKPDIVVHLDYQIAVYQNVNQGGDITDASFVRTIYPVQITDNFYLADIDGNGLKDIIGKNGTKLMIYRNFSVPGFIFFDVPLEIPVPNMRDFTVADFDQDGRPDIAGVYYIPGDSTMLTIRSNRNSGSSFMVENFVEVYNLGLPYYGYYLKSADLNNDGKPDIISGAPDRYFISMLENNSHDGTLAFERTTMEDLSHWPHYIAYDLNQDDFREIVSQPKYNPGELKVFQNKRTVSDIGMDAAVRIMPEHTVTVAQPGDINGDGKVDLVAGIDSGKFVLLFNNNIPGGNISSSSFNTFDVLGDLDLYTQFSDVAVNDLNGDGRPEVITNYNHNRANGMQLEIWQNSPGDCPDPDQIIVDPSVYHAAITLPPNTTFQDFEMEITEAGTEWWWSLESPAITGLSPGTQYVLRIRARCYLSYTGYTDLYFTTDCTAEQTVWMSTIGVNYAYVHALDFGKTEIQYSLAGQNDWTTLSPYVNFIGNLTPGTAYEVRYKTQCTDDYRYLEFATLCPSLEAIYISYRGFDRAVVQWSGGQHGEIVVEYSADFTNWTAVGADGELSPLIPGKTYYVRGFVKCNDINAGNVTTSFTTLCGNVWDLNVTEQTPFSARISWTDYSGSTRFIVRYRTANELEETIVETASAFIDLEGLTPGTNYVVAVAPYCYNAMDFAYRSFTTICYSPFDLVADEVTHTTASLSWNDSFGSPVYYVHYSLEGSNVWQTMEASSTNITLNELRPGGRYEARVRIGCQNVAAPYATLHFGTDFYDATTLSPNPTYGEVELNPSMDLIGRKFSIVDYMGKKVVGGVLSSYSFDLSGYAAGVYLLKIDGESPIKIFKQ